MKTKLYLLGGLVIGVTISLAGIANAAFVPISIPAGGTGTTTAPVSQLIYSGGTSYQSVATTTASCSGSASCTAFTIIGSTPVTISATGGSGSGNVSTSTNETAGSLAYWTSTSATPALLGKVATTTLTASGVLSLSQPISVIGGSASVLSFTGTLIGDPFTHSSVWGQTTSATSTLLALTGSPYSLVASSTAVINALVTGSTTPTAFANAPLLVIGRSANYNQAVIQNLASGANASSLLAIHADIGTDSSYFTELGINNSAYSQATFSAQNQLDSFLTASDGALVIGTASSTNTLAGLRFLTGGTASSSIRMSISQNGYLMVGTTTQGSISQLTIGSSTASQISLSANTAGVNLWGLRVMPGGDLAFSTTTVVGTATTSTSALILQTSGVPSIKVGTSTCMGTLKNGTLCLGGGGDSAGNTGSTTIFMGKMQWDGVNNTGARTCAFFVGTTLTVVANACTP